jgi:nitrite reductase/ring-hydroxylating ferredoxin subunit
LLDELLLVVRDQKGQVHVLSAVCQHRGMIVAEGSGNCNKFLCPYHHWSYALDGKLLAMPEMDKAAKLENFNDGYHAHRLHSGIGDHVPAENARFLDWDDDENHVTRLNYFTHIDGGFNSTRKTLLPVFEKLSNDERHRAVFALLPPSLGLAVTPDSITYFIVNPKAAEAIDIHIGYCMDPRAPKEPLFELLFRDMEAGVNDFNIKDIHADTMVQKGLRSRFGPHGRYSWQEETLQQFNRWLVKRYRANWPSQD